MQLKNKLAIITGAANGLGKALAIELYQQGCDLALIDINYEGLEQLKTELERQGQKISIHRFDISKEEEIIACKNEILSLHKSVDILINNAGVSISRFFEQMGPGDHEWLFNINFWGTVNCSKHFLPELRKQKEGHLVNIISDFALMGFPGKTAYASSKAAVMGFTNSLKTELAGSTIKLSLVIPPPLDTGLVRSSKHVNEDKRTRESEFVKRHGMSLEKVAKKIIKKVKRNKYRIVIGTLMFWTDLFSRLFPSMVHKIIGKNKKKIDFI